MGLFKRSTRVAEGGAYAAGMTRGGDEAAASAAVTASKPKEDLGLFGADSDDSDDDATIDRYAKKNGEDEAEAEGDGKADEENRKVSVLLSKMTPEELFKRYDTDGSGNISLAEFLAMLPELGIRMSKAKAIRIFKKCDTDGTGEIDLTEFKTAMFAVDPVSGNTLGFTPSAFLAPRDAFELFDEDGTGKIDELEFADVLEYFGMNVSVAKQEAMFKKYDKDKSGYIDYKEFRSMWIRLSNVREELEKRGVDIPKYATPWKLQHMLEEILDQEEAREALVLAEAQKFLEKQREKQRREELGRKALIRAQDELAAALDAAGQVYVLGTGKYGQFNGEAVVRDETRFPGFKAVSEIWGFRVDPKVVEDKIALVQEESNTKAPEQQAQEVITVEETADKEVPKRKGKYVRRRPENTRWGFHSPPKLNVQTMQALKQQVKSAHDENLDDQDADKKPEVNPSQASKEESNEAWLARLLYEDREFIRSLRFQSTVIMHNTGCLWGRGVLCGALSDDVAFAVTQSGSVFTWGGKDRPKESTLIQRVALLNDDDGDENGESDTQDGVPTSKIRQKTVEQPEHVTPRSSMVKMTMASQMDASKEDETEQELRQEYLLEAEIKQREQHDMYAKLKSVVVYYNEWEPPPSNATKMLFMEQVLLPRLKYEKLQASARYRGLEEYVTRITKLELIILMADCFALEREVNGEAGHADLKAQEELITELEEAKDKRSKLKLETEKQNLLAQWSNLHTLREERRAITEREERQKEIERLNRLDATFEAVVARRHVQMEDLIPEYTTRGVNPRLELSGMTTRGPALRSPRGAVAVASISAGRSHAAALMHDGSIYTWGIGFSGRLGLSPPHSQQLTRPRRLLNANHPQRVDAFTDVSVRQVSCGVSHSAAVGNDGQLFTWGSAVDGKLGVGVVEDRFEQFSTEPLTVKFPGGRKIRSVSCGASHTGAVTTQGELFMWGSANGGRLGLGADVQDTLVAPTLVKVLSSRKIRVWQVSCGTTHSALCTETTSESRGGSKTLLGGHVYICGGPTALGKHMPTWVRVESLVQASVAIKQLSCGIAHTTAVSAYGELYTWGRNAKGCTGHSTDRLFIPSPELVRSLHVEPYNLALGKNCKQINIYNEQGPEMAVNGDIVGRLERCCHTHLEEKPWWEVDLGQPAVIERIRVWNRTDEPSNPSKRRDEYTGRLFPFWILVSEFPFRADLQGKEGLRAAKNQSAAFIQIEENRRLTEWLLPTAQTIGQYVRIQLQGRNFLHLAEVEVFGVYSAFNYVGRVGEAHAGNDATLVVVPPSPQQTALDDYYLRAIQADADNATILRQFEVYESSCRRFGRGNGDVLGGKCRLCRVFRECEVCEFVKTANATGEMPRRIVGDRMGLVDLVKLAVDDDGLEEEAHRRERQRVEERAVRLAAEVKRNSEESAVAAARKLAAPALLKKVLPGPMRKITAAFPLRKAANGDATLPRPADKV